MNQPDLLPPPEADELDRLTALAGSTAAQNPDKWPRLLANMLDVVDAAFRRQGLAAAQAGSLARLAMLALAKYHGGVSFYLPSGEEIERALRDDEIWRDIGPLSAEDLARRHEISVQRVYQIYAEQRALRKARQQPGLF